MFTSASTLSEEACARIVEAVNSRLAEGLADARRAERASQMRDPGAVSADDVDGEGAREDVDIGASEVPRRAATCGVVQM